jgi:hypothetical protein
MPGDVWPLPIDNSPRWTPRRALLLTAWVLLGLGILGFFVDWRRDAPFYLDIEKQAIFIVLAVFMLYTGETWDSAWKRWVAGPLSIVFTAAGASSLILEEPNLGPTLINSPWEAIYFLVTGIWTAVTVWYPRPFYDYEYGTGVSTGLKDR